jgi:hypothetical protein
VRQVSTLGQGEGRLIVIPSIGINQHQLGGGS